MRPISWPTSSARCRAREPSTRAAQGGFATLTAEAVGEAPTDKAWASAWLTVLLLGVALGSRRFGAPVPLADLAWSAAIVGASGSLGRRVWRPPPFGVGLLAFVLAALVSGVPPWLAGSKLFAPAEFAKSAAKLMLYAAGTVVCWNLACALPRSRLHEIVASVFALAAGVGLVLYLAPGLGLPLPHSLLCGEHVTGCSALFYERRWFGDASSASFASDAFWRAQGLADEPTRFGYLQTMALAFLLLAPGRQRAPVRQVSIAVSALLSFALAPYALLTCLLAFVGLQGRSWRQRARLGLAGVLACGLVVLLPGARASLDHAVVGRLARMAAGDEDSSARLRVVGSWRLALGLAAVRPLTGVGLGNHDVAVAGLRERFPEQRFLTGSIQGWNALAHTLGTTGLIGLAALLALGIQALRRQPALATLFLMGCFADGALLSAAFWSFFALYALPPPPGATAADNHSR